MSRKLILGSVSPRRLADLAPIGVVNGRSIFPLHGAEDDKPAGDGGENESEEDEDGDEDDEDDEDSKASDDEDKKKPRRSRRDTGDSSVIRNMRKELRELRREKTERLAAERQKALKEKPELERLTVERDDAVKERDTLREQHREASIELAIVRASNRANSKYSWADIEDVLSDRTLRKAIEIDDDGEISGVEEALKDLAKRKPHFLLSKSEEDSKGKGNGKPATNGGGGNGKSGGTPNGAGGDGKAADRAALEAKYPILARMPQ